MGKHTPGQHTVVEADHLGDPAFAIRAADGDLVAVGMIKADAVLFAAAPEMLEALQAFVAYDAGDQTDGVKLMLDYVEAVDLAKTALAKAGA